ncbi:uncharacterized protein [Argopecten irradians]|uniref:uncharacterized protein n=1 Tax=Argopecten irradians TaxID=31199 RepID=UPI003719280D
MFTGIFPHFHLKEHTIFSMETFSLTCILLIFTANLVNGADPDCTALTPHCTGTQTCGWDCTVSGNPTGDIDVSKCTSADTCTKGSETGTCAPACKDNSAGPDCSAIPSCAGKTCSWDCTVTGSVTGNVNLVDVSKCTSAKTCTKGSTSGTCASTCKDNPDCTALSPQCTGTQTCGWDCTVSGNPTGDIDVSKCTSLNTCKKGSTTGTCAPACKDNSGTKKNSANGAHGLSPLLLISAVIIKFSLSL